MRATAVLAIAFVGLVPVGSVDAAPRDSGPACGQTISVDTTLTRSLHCSGGGLIVAAGADVTLDLNGHAIVGTGTGTGLDTSSAGQATVQNGTIRGFAFGIVGSETTSVLALRLIGNGTGASFSEFNDRAPQGGPVVQGSVISASTGTGLADSATGGQFTSNRIVENGGDGIALGGHADGTTISGNRISRNGGAGIDDNESFADFTDNRLVGNGAEGIVVIDSLSVYSFTGNVALRNGGDGILAVAGSTDGGGNTARGNAGPEQCLNIVCQDAGADTADTEADPGS